MTGIGDDVVGEYGGQGQDVGPANPDADSNDHLREAVKTETPIFGQAVTKGAMLNFPTPKKMVETFTKSIVHIQRS